MTVGSLPEEAFRQGLNKIAGCDDPHRKMDVVFVHGLGGDSWTTWMAKQDDTSSFWPGWLADDVPGLGVWTLGYAARGSKWNEESMPLADRGNQVLDLLVSSGLGNLPLAFITHSMGGIVVKQILRHADSLGVKRYESIRDQTRGIVFIATPHAGAEIANFVALAAALYRINEPVNELQEHSARLRELHGWFLNKYLVGRKVSCRTYCERREVRPDIPLLNLKLPKGILVVNETSAEPNIPGERAIPLDEDHISICKPKGKDAQIYKGMLQFVQECLPRSSSGVPPEIVTEPSTGPSLQAASSAAGQPTTTDASVHTTFPIETFRDHCVVNPAWVDLVSRTPATSTPFHWHPNVERMLNLVFDNSDQVDSNVYLLPWATSGDAALKISNYKKSFFDHQTALDELLTKVAASYNKLLKVLSVTTAEHRGRALHTFAAACALSVIRVLQRFEGKLFTRERRLLVRLFPDLPYLRDMSGPMVGLPYLHAVNALAYGWQAEQGFLKCRISPGQEADWECLFLPHIDAVAHHGRRPGPAYLYFGWVVPQWLLFVDRPPPSEDAWWITVLSDEEGGQRYFRSQESPWSGPDMRYRELPSRYDLPASFYKLVEVEPRMWCWVTREKLGK